MMAKSQEQRAKSLHDGKEPRAKGKEPLGPWRAALSSLPLALRKYFRSGWAFLIPYLAAYLLYAWLDWPVNPPSAESLEPSAGSIGGNADGEAPLPFAPCSLLTLYWTLHGAHALLAAIALHSWWRGAQLTAARQVQSAESKESFSTDSTANSREEQSAKREEGAKNENAPLHSTPLAHGASRLALSSSRREAASLSRFPLRSWPLALSEQAFRLLPWALLALLFYIPGIYLEWPSDPWEHLRRINEWHVLESVGEHSAWKKSSYFLPYSLTQFAVGLEQLRWLNFYYTGVCLLLSWQYYRLARAVGLGERVSFVFVLLNAFTFGNSIFSFYRYYGISSSIFAQIGAVALTRIALEYAKGIGQGPNGDELRAKSKAPSARPQLSLRHFRLPAWLHRRFRGADSPRALPPARRPTSTAHCPPATVYRAAPQSSSTRHPPFSDHRAARPLVDLPVTAYGLLWSGALLLTFVAFNHIQGLGIAGLGVAAVIVWRLIEWKRSMIAWLSFAAVLLSVATVLWFPRHPAIDDVYRSLNWMTPWYGFNLFDPSSPAFDRMMQIIGALGVINLIAGLWLLRWNHIAGWLTLMPIIVLSLPCVALPFAHVVVSTTSIDNIITFHRMLFAVPMGLALLASTSCWTRSATRSAEQEAQRPRPEAGTYSLPASRYSLFCYIGLAGAALLILSPGSSSYNRLWNSLQILPSDLQLKHISTIWTSKCKGYAHDDSTLVVMSPLATEVSTAFSPRPGWAHFRSIRAPLATSEIQQRLDWIAETFVPEWTPRPLAFGPVKFAPDSVLFSRAASHLPTLDVNFTTTATPWHGASGEDPMLLPVAGRLIVSNPVGNRSEALTTDFAPVAAKKRYQLTASVRQIGDPGATNYLAVAWYDRQGKLLESNVAAPVGAGQPVGWSIGTYSYFGLSDQPAPPEWTTYTVSFGLGEPAALPNHAAFVRVGALLNYGSSPRAIVEVTDVVLREKPAHSQLLFISIPMYRLYTPLSLAARLSRHWSPQRVVTEHGGSKELQVWLGQ